MSPDASLFCIVVNCVPQQHRQQQQQRQQLTVKLVSQQH
jgi:hypothetical protein